MNRERVLTVSIGIPAIEQGDISPPRVGKLIEITLDFVETPRPPSDETMTVQAVLDLQPTPRLEGFDSHPDGRYWCWIGDLYGDGWRATWLGRRPRTGPVTVTGRFQNSRGLAYKPGSDHRVRGRVVRVRVQTLPYHRPDGGGWERLPGGPHSYRDVAIAPRWFNRDGLRDGEPSPNEVVWKDSGVVIDIDLHDVPPRTPRPKIVPGDVSAGDHGIWVVDNQLPVIALLSGDTATEYLFAGEVTSGRAIRATPDGCLIFDGGHTYRCTVGQPIEKIATAPGVTIDGVERTIERVDRETSRVVLTPLGADRTVVHVIPAGHVVVASTVENNCFIIAVQDVASADKPTHLVRITTTGNVTLGPPLPHDKRDWEKRITLVNRPLRVVRSNAIVPIRDDLTAGEPVVLGEFVLWAGQVGDTAWIVTHPPSGGRRGPHPWWPLPEPVEYDDSRGQFWLLTLLDSGSQPLFSYPTSSTRPSVAIDRDGGFWITDRGLRRLPAEPMQWSDPVDFDAAITRTIAPAIDGDGDRL